MRVNNGGANIEIVSAAEDAGDAGLRDTSDQSAAGCCTVSGKLQEGVAHEPEQADDLERTNSKAGRLAGPLSRPRSYLIGAAAALGVVGFYLGLLTLMSDWNNAVLEFREYGLWILALAAGLGVQATLFSLFRAWHQGEDMKAAKCTLAASGGMSTTAMAACCAHYLTVFLPALGLPFLSAATAGLARYQTYFFLAGVLSNMFGIGLMLRMMVRSGMIQVGALASYLAFGLGQTRR